jgi:hypothetical protein
MAHKLYGEDKPDGFYFARLRLKNSQGELLDENLYWLTGSDSDWLKLEELKPAQIEVSVKQGASGKLEASIKNTGTETAFFMRLKLSDKTSGELILPVYMEDNYLTLFPGESRVIGIDLSHLPEDVSKADKQLEVSPWSGETVISEL